MAHGERLEPILQVLKDIYLNSFLTQLKNCLYIEKSLLIQGLYSVLALLTSLPSLIQLITLMFESLHTSGFQNSVLSCFSSHLSNHSFIVSIGKAFLLLSLSVGLPSGIFLTIKGLHYTHLPFYLSDLTSSSAVPLTSLPSAPPSSAILPSP